MKGLTAPRRRVLAILYEYDAPATSRDVARQLWPDSWAKASKQGVHGQWLPGRAARLLYAMQQDKLVVGAYGIMGRTLRWSLTPTGREALAGAIAF